MRVPSENRRLIAVVYADMVGYSRLIGLDDIGTLDRLRTLRLDVIDPAIAEHGGRVVQTGGDSLLIVFDSIEGAVRCAVNVQQKVPQHDDGQPADRSIRFRIGIDIGDAIADGTDLHGDGVIVAARLQAECPPGGICVSRAVRDHVHDRLNLAFDALGPLNLKNITRPVEAFVLRPAAGASGPATMALLGNTPETLPLPDRPSIAVLAFTNMSGDTEQEYFSDGIADDIITELSRMRWLFVIARNTSFTYKGHAIDVKQVGRELGVRYVLEGSVRRGGQRVRVNAQLIDAETGAHVWAQRYDRDLADVFAVQDEITLAVTGAIGPAVSDAEQRRALRKPPESLGAWEAYQRGLWHLEKMSVADHGRARDFFRRAIVLDPLFASAHAMLAFVHLISQVFGDTRPLRESLDLAAIEAQRAIELDPDESSAIAVLADIACSQARYERALEQAERAISVNPNNIIAYFAKGRVLTFSGRPDEATETLLIARSLSPRDALAAPVLEMLVYNCYFSMDYIGAAKLAQRAVQEHANYAPLHRILAASLGQLGRVEEAGESLGQAQALIPTAFDFFVRSRPPWRRQVDHDHILAGLRKAGWQG